MYGWYGDFTTTADWNGALYDSRWVSYVHRQEETSYPVSKHEWAQFERYDSELRHAHDDNAW